MYSRSERQRLRSRAAVERLHSSDLRAAATTGKEREPPEELVAEFRRARAGCWDAEAGSLVEKVLKARRAVRRREVRSRREVRAAAKGG